MKKSGFLYRNGLSLVFLLLFLIALVAEALMGWKAHSEEFQNEHARALALSAFLSTGHFVSSTFKNFQSELFQMALYLVLIVGLRQQGSAESKNPDGPEEVYRGPVVGKGAIGPVKKEGWLLKLYNYSLSIAFVFLFFVSWGFHLCNRWVDHNDEQHLQGKGAESLFACIGEPNFWFETFQNWQSELLSVPSIVLPTIFLRQKGSPESKPVDAPHMEPVNNFNIYG